jgi:hypothetical protein
MLQARDIACLGDYWTFGKDNRDTRFRKKVILLLGKKEQ